MSVRMNHTIGGINSLDLINTLEINRIDNMDKLEEVAEDIAYDTYESTKEDENVATPCENYNDLLQTMKYVKVQQMSGSNTDNDSSYEETRREN